MTRKDVIWQELASVYSKGGQMSPGGMVEDCAEDLDAKWERLVSEGESNYSRGFETEVMVLIWNWFAGGGTAEIAARRVIQAVDSMDQE